MLGETEAGKTANTGKADDKLWISAGAFFSEMMRLHNLQSDPWTCKGCECKHVNCVSKHDALIIE